MYSAVHARLCCDGLRAAPHASRMDSDSGTVQMVPDDDEEIEDEWADTETQGEGDATASAMQITLQARAHTCCSSQPRDTRAPSYRAAGARMHGAVRRTAHARDDGVALVAQARLGHHASEKEWCRIAAFWCVCTCAMAYGLAL
eukprot:7184716-Prymnesium_polylepis.1